MKSKMPILQLICIIMAMASGASYAKPSHPSDGRVMFKTAFNPERYFPFNYNGVRADGTMGTEELILTAKVSARDDYLPSHALAVAYTCAPATEKGSYICQYTARMLRFKKHAKDEFGAALALAKSVNQAKNANAKRRAYGRGGLEWLETKLVGCDGAVEAMDQLAQKADWKPSLHYSRIKMEDRALALHPAQMWITMNGDERISRWQGWRNADGAAYGVNNLITKLDKCWKPSKARKPWLKK